MKERRVSLGREVVDPLANIVENGFYFYRLDLHGKNSVQPMVPTLYQVPYHNQKMTSHGVKGYCRLVRR